MVYWHRPFLAYTKWTEFSKTLRLLFFSFISYFVGVVIQQEVVRRNLC